MVIVKCQRFFDAWGACSSFNFLRVLFDLGPRVQVIVTFPRLLSVPPLFCVPPMRPEIEDVANYLGLLSDRGSKLGFVDQDSLAL